MDNNEELVSRDATTPQILDDEGQSMTDTSKLEGLDHNATTLGGLKAYMQDGMATPDNVTDAKDAVIAALPKNYATSTNVTSAKDAVISALPKDYAKPADITSAKEAVIAALPSNYAKASDVTSAKEAVVSALPKDYAKSSEVTAAKEAVVSALPSDYAKATNLQTVDDNVDAIKAVVDSRGVAASDIATKANVTSILDAVNALGSNLDTYVGAVSNPEIRISGTTVTIKLSDPTTITHYRSGVSIGTVPWQRTVVVKKSGSVPTSVSDGTIVFSNTTRDKYKTTGYSDTQSSPATWKYAAFVSPVASGDNYANTATEIPVKVKVTYNANGGSVSTTSADVVYGKTYGTMPTPTRSGYDFLGWYTAATSGTNVTASSTVSTTTAFTLYAQWQKSVTVYGFVINESNSNEATCVSYNATYTDASGATKTVANSSFSALSVNFNVTDSDTNIDGDAPSGSCNWGSWKNTFIMPKPCMLKYNGTVDYYLNPDNLALKAAGGNSDIANTSYGGNAMMEWVPIYTKATRSGHNLTVCFADSKIDDTWECYSAKKADGTYAPHFYTAIFEGSDVNGKIRSMKTLQKPSNSKSMATEMSMCRANDSTASNKYWAPELWCDEDLIRGLIILVTKRLNSQACLSGNPAQGDDRDYTYDENDFNNVGTGYRKGMFYGQSSSVYTGINSKVFGMENRWGNCGHRVHGIINDKGHLRVKNTLSTIDGSTVSDYLLEDDSDYAAGYVDSGVSFSSSTDGYIKTMAGVKGMMFAPKTMGGGETIYYCDYGRVSAEDVSSLSAGGYWDDGSYAGAFFSYLVFYYPSDAFSYLGASLSCKPF